jgi:hypothetical protein
VFASFSRSPAAAFFAALAVWLAPPSAHGQIQPLPALHADNSFGAAVALSGSAHGGRRALVGASGENVCGPNSGAVYVYEKTGSGTWRQAARLAPSDCEAGAFFGRSLALSGDRALVGASKEFFADQRPNVAYVFERDETTGRWQETARLTVDPERSEGSFAASVTLDGTRALVTSRGRLPSSEQDPQSPSSAAGGAAYVFELGPRTEQWCRVARLTPRTPDSRRAFGGTGALDGDRLAVTASPYFADAPGAVYVFELRGPDASAHWEQTALLEGFTDFSISVALDGDRLLVGESRAGDDREGAAVLFERNAAGAWVRRARLLPRTPYRDGAFGTSVSLSGDRALITGYDEQLGLDFNIDRVVYVFERRGAAWVQHQILDVGDVAFGTTIDHYGGEALVGHVPDGGPGTVYVIGLR